MDRPYFPQHRLSAAALCAPDKIIEIDNKLFRSADVVFQFFNVFKRKFGSRGPGGLGDHLNHGGVLEHDAADRHFLDGGADNHDAVIFQKHGPICCEHVRDIRAHRLGPDQVYRTIVKTQRPMEQGAGLAIGL
jgi:hypothetical protein